MVMHVTIPAILRSIQARFELTFSAGLEVTGETADKVTEQLTKFATGSAYVEAAAVEAIAEPVQ
jgi:hypothetical protein